MSWFRRHPVSDADLSAWVDGALTPDRTARITAHVDGCDSCRTQIEELRQVKAMVHALPRPSATRSFEVRPAAGQIEVRQRQPAPRRRYALAPAAALTVLLLLLGADLVAYPAGNESSRPAAAPAIAKSSGAAENGGPETTLSDRAANAVPSAVAQVPALNNAQPQSTAVPPAAAAGAPAPPTGAVAGQPQTTPATTGPRAFFAPTPTNPAAAAGQADAARPPQPQLAPEAPTITAVVSIPSKPSEPQPHASTRRVLRVLEGVAAIALAASLIVFVAKLRSSPS